MITRLLLIVLIFSLSGCASVSQFLAKVEDKLTLWTRSDSEDVRMTYADIMDTQTVRNTPGEGYRWHRPVVQSMEVPNMIRGGVMIPKHEEYVIVTDAAYVMDDQASDSLRRKYRVPPTVELVSPMKGSDVVVGLFRMNRVFGESAVVPISKVSFLLQNRSMDQAFALFNDEVAPVGHYLCAFSREKGDDFIAVRVVENSLNKIKKYSLSKSEVLFLSNGYAIVPMFEKNNRKGDS
jgi:hypothetical protein